MTACRGELRAKFPLTLIQAARAAFRQAVREIILQVRFLAPSRNCAAQKLEIGSKA